MISREEMKANKSMAAKKCKNMGSSTLSQWKNIEIMTHFRKKHAPPKNYSKSIFVSRIPNLLKDLT